MVELARADASAAPATMAAMHLIIPYAASHALTGQDALSRLQLPNLTALLRGLQRQTVWQDPPDTPWHMPHERVHAQALGGWGPMPPATPNTGLPWAAWHTATTTATASTALPCGAEGHSHPAPQAFMTPCHWQVGMDQVLMLDPDSLFLSDEESQLLLQAMQPFFQEDGLHVTWRSALQWHVQGDLLTGLATASLDRVIGQNVKAWLPESVAARPWQRLQSEMQMLLYNHPVNNAREARRQHTVNAFWLHGAGSLTHQLGNAAPLMASDGPVAVPDGLRHSALRGDALAWQQAWQALDATDLAALRQHFKSTGQARLSLCSEHTAHTYTPASTAWHQRIARAFHPTSAQAALADLIAP